ncbi:MAG: hypothetical protein C0P61_000035 [Bacillota bacterium]|nr:hypothetical protein [Bacillota bacterium]REJ34658.1 MAG: hypothetical protein DIU82_08655 [Bacillota bacterium]
MGTAVAAERVRLDEARLEQVKAKFLELLEMDRSSPEFMERYREVDAALDELAFQAPPMS